MYHLHDTVLIPHNITITDHWYLHMLFELIDACEVSLSSECLFIGATMHRDEIGTRVLESLDELHEEVRIFPSEASLHGNWYFYRICHFFHDLECCITIDHER
jgi:hypothetical protein